MTKEFTLEVLTPSKSLTATTVSEVVMPGYDGEVGVLADHEDFVGMLGTGPLKYVKGGNDYWLMISQGVYEVREGQLTVLAKQAEPPTKDDPEVIRTQLRTLEEKLFSTNSESEEAKVLKLDIERTKARLDVHRRTEILN